MLSSTVARVIEVWSRRPRNSGIPSSGQVGVPHREGEALWASVPQRPLCGPPTQWVAAVKSGRNSILVFLAIVWQESHLCGVFVVTSSAMHTHLSHCVPLLSDW